MYVPILKNRMFENKFLGEWESSFFNENLMPYIQIVDDKIGRQKNQPVLTIAEYYRSLIHGRFFLEMFVEEPNQYRPFDISKTQVLLKYRNPVLYVQALNEISALDRVIPVISINGNIDFSKDAKEVIKIVSNLQKNSISVAVRLNYLLFDVHFAGLDSILRDSDFLFFDINETPIESKHFSIEAIKKSSANYSKILMHSPRKRKINNTSYQDGDFTTLIDNSLLNKYKECGFSGIADYAGLKDNLPNDARNFVGAAIAFLYSASRNAFFTIVNKNTSDGVRGYSYIVSQIEKIYKPMLDPNNDCPAIKYINDNMINKSKNGNWAQWHYVTILRYISQIFINNLYR